MENIVVVDTDKRKSAGLRTHARVHTRKLTTYQNQDCVRVTPPHSAAAREGLQALQPLVGRKNIPTCGLCHQCLGGAGSHHCANRVMHALGRTVTWLDPLAVACPAA
jgi:hypothetical protein